MRSTMRIWSRQRAAGCAGGRFRSTVRTPFGRDAQDPLGRTDRPGERMLHDAPRGAGEAHALALPLGYQALLDLIATARGSLRIVEIATPGATAGGRSN